MKEVNISHVDALFSNGSYSIEFLFYYKEGFHTKKIRSALKKLSSEFWPLFGEYKDGKISFEKYVEVECYEEEVVSQEFNVPETEKERSEAHFHYSLPDTKRLFFLKVMHFTNGMILVPKMKHLAGDGYSYFYFLSALAMLSHHTLFPSQSSLMKLFLKPHHRRTSIKPFSFKGIELDPIRQNGEFTIQFDEIPRKDVSSIIKEVSNSKNYQISTNDVLSALAIKKLVKVQSDFYGESFELTIPIDVRRHVKEYGRRFFGNGIMLHTMTLKKDDIQNLSTTEMAIQIRKSMPSMSKPSYIDYLIHLEGIISEKRREKFKPYDPRSGCLVTNITRLPVDKLNFGTGSPSLIFPLTMERNSTAIFTKEENFILRFAY